MISIRYNDVHYADLIKLHVATKTEGPIEEQDRAVSQASGCGFIVVDSSVFRSLDDLSGYIVEIYGSWYEYDGADLHIANALCAHNPDHHIINQEDGIVYSKYY